MSIKNFFKKVPAPEDPEEDGKRPAKKAKLADEEEESSASPQKGKGKTGAASPAKVQSSNTTTPNDVTENKTDSKSSVPAPVAAPAGSVMAAAQALPVSWSEVLKAEFAKPYFSKLNTFVGNEITAKKDIYPPAADIFSAFHLAPFDKVTVVIVGQDPYHGPGQAHGLAFSVRNGVQVPPSLVNMYKELTEDPKVEFKRPAHGNLEKWASQGVFMLNTVLTVRKGEPNSHKGQGWETFTDAVIRELNARKKGLVFLLWGKPAEQKCKAVDKSKHHVLTAPHPSPLSASKGWFGCRHFSKTNELLEKGGKNKIDWQN